MITLTADGLIGADDIIGDFTFKMILTGIDWDPVIDYAETLIGSHRGPGGRNPGRIRYTLKGLLVVSACLLRDGRTPSLRRIQRVLLYGLTDTQRADLGVVAPAVDIAAVQASKRAREREYTRFSEWVSRQLQWFDPHFDIPARKITNGEYKELLRDRSDADREAAAAAFDAAHTVANLIVAGSIKDKQPAHFEGDLVADESIYNVSKVDHGDGMRDDLKRSAVPMAALYRRQEGVVKVGPNTGATREKMAWGIGVTALQRVGPPGHINDVLPLIVGVAFGPPTSASVPAVAECLKHAHANKVTGPPPAGSASRHRTPYFTTDMAYNSHRGWADLMFDYGYHPIGRYPEGWNLVSHLEPTRSDDISPGPIQAHGALYCPAALELATPRLTRRAADIAVDGNANHDERLSRLLPMLMGTNSRLRKAAPNPGRPRKDEEQAKVYKIDLVCPAVQGRVRCPLKPESMLAAAVEAPTLAPTWNADAKRCCAQSQVSVTLTDRQFRLMQPGLPPGSWEHTFLYEAYRALNERIFSLLKSPYTSNQQAMNWGPRRDPMLMLNLSLCIAVTNLHMQWTWTPDDVQKFVKRDSVSKRFRKLDKELGRSATRVPPRT